ncbi:heat stress transcription factor B-2b-like isoform X1 [Wolffia australiana]
MAVPAPFLSKTYQLVDDPTVNDVISWNEDGSSFVIWRPPEFARDLLPKFFKHSNFSSFVRQLNTYGFRKLVADRWEFANDCFRRGERGLLGEINRRKIAQQQAAPPAAADSGEDSFFGGNLTAENLRLRRENERLRSELGLLRGLCDKVLCLLSGYAGEAGERQRRRREEGSHPRLFGVSIGVKRERSKSESPPCKSESPESS